MINDACDISFVYSGSEQVDFVVPIDHARAIESIAKRLAHSGKRTVLGAEQNLDRESLIRANTELCRKIDELRAELDATARFKNQYRTERDKLAGAQETWLSHTEKLNKRINDLERQLDEERFKQVIAPAVTERVVYVPYQTNPYPATWQTPYVVTCGATAGTKDCSTSEYGTNSAKLKA